MFRVDRSDVPTWTAIDGGEAAAPKTLEDAKALAERWVAAVNKSRTLNPSPSLYRTAAKKAAKTQKTSKVKKKAGPGGGRTFLFAGRSTHVPHLPQCFSPPL